MLLDRRELYQKIIDKIEIKARELNILEVQVANSLGIKRTTYFMIKKYANEGGKKNILSLVRLKKLCNNLEMTINNTFYDVIESKDKVE